MKIKQIISIVGLLVIGIVIGKFAFNTASETSTENKKMTEHWTCSMHPQIDMPTFGKCPICGMDLIPKDGGNNNTLSANSFSMTKNAMALANIETIVVGGSKDEKESNNNTLELSGEITANDKASAVQTAHFGGRLERLHYKTVGEYVSKGSFMATVYSPALVTAQNEFIEALAIKNLQPELYKAVRNKLKNWKISERQINEIEQAKKVTTNFNMYANVSGYITDILVQEGSHVNEGTPLFKVSSLGTVWAVFNVYENDIKHIKKGETIAITFQAFPDEINKAKIDFIDPNLNTSTRTIAVRATLKNKNNRLKPGMFVTSVVDFEKGENTSSTTIVRVPKSAVLWTGKRSIVYVKEKGDTPVFELRKVTLGIDTGSDYEILKGLENGEEIVVHGTFTVDAVAQLQGKKSMMNMHTIEKITLNPKFKKQLEVVFEDYDALKTAFVSSDAEKVRKIAKKILQNLQTVNSNLFKSKKAQSLWMSVLPKIKNALKTIEQETVIEKQRIAFINLSNAMIELATNFDVEKTIYVQHCPMANDNNGADWLSFSKQIRNPYFGDAMLECGSVKQVIE